MPNCARILGDSDSRQDHRSPPFHSTNHSTKRDAQTNPASAPSSHCSCYRSPIRVHVAEHQGAGSRRRERPRATRRGAPLKSTQCRADGLCRSNGSPAGNAMPGRQSR